VQAAQQLGREDTGYRVLLRYDRDPVNHPDMPEHRHVPPDNRREKWSRVTLADVSDEMWDHVRQRAAEVEATDQD
jgi:hypothetical protein